jgi:plastocyanin
MRTALILIATSTMWGIACSESTDPQDLCSAPTATTRVEMKDFAYVPTCVSASAGSTLTLQNTGATPHTFTVQNSDDSVDVAAGETGTLDIADLSSGTYEVICTYHPQMKAALRVT